MSNDLLAEFDSFYRAPQRTNPSTVSAATDLSFLDNSAHGTAGSAESQWQMPATATSMNHDAWGTLSSTQPSSSTQLAPQPLDDPWRSFEAVIPQNHKPVQIATSMRNSNAEQTTTSQIRSGIVRRPTVDLFSRNVYDIDALPPQSQPNLRNVIPPKTKPVRQGSSGGDILFDAADELSADDDDDFGDFETVAEPAPLAKEPPPSDSLLDFFGSMSVEPKTSKRPKDLLPTTNTLAGGLPYPQAPKSPSFQERNPFSGIGLATTQATKVKETKKPQSASPVTAWPTFEPVKPKIHPYKDSPIVQNEPEDEWGDFTDLAPETPAAACATATSGIEADAWAWDTADQVTESVPPVPVALPPTNVPPPSVILALFPPLFDLPQSTLFKAVANQPFSLKNRIISDPTTIDFLRAYLLIATVAARIISGRKLRWKRDTILSQAMKIGPAAAGGKGGMKLTGVDKSEQVREDREAADVIRVWREQLGRLKSAVAVANTSIKNVSRHLEIPDLSETMHIKTQDGVVTAPKPCVVCGLKRDERIGKVDVHVEDSFGEWWTEHWGHRACRNFWQQHESKLKHR